MEPVNHLVYFSSMRRNLVSASDLLAALPKNIHLARKKAGLSQTALAAACGVDRQTVYRWESGDREPSASALGVLAQVLDVSPGYLVGLEA